jgi:peroxiredoxin
MLTAGAQAPDFALLDLAGASRRLISYAEQGPALFVFYKASCPVCQLTLPFLERIKEKPAVRIVLISQDDVKTTMKFQKEFGLSLETLIDGRGYPASNAYGLESVPTLFLVQQGGVIAQSWSGFSKADMEGLASMAGQPIFHPNENVPLFRPG